MDLQCQYKATVTQSKYTAEVATLGGDLSEWNGLMTQVGFTPFTTTLSEATLAGNNVIRVEGNDDAVKISQWLLIGEGPLQVKHQVIDVSPIMLSSPLLYDYVKSTKVNFLK